MLAFQDKAVALYKTMINSIIVRQPEPELLREKFEALQFMVLDAKSGP